MKEDRALFEKYYRINTVLYEEATQDNCDDTCQTFHFCAQYELDYSEFEKCVEDKSRNNRSNVRALASSLSILIGVSFMLN